MANAMFVAASVGLATGGAHYAAHVLVGDADAFEDAGVMQAGITVLVAATLATYAVLRLGVAG